VAVNAFPLILLAFVVLVGLIAYFSFQAKKKRRAAFAALGAQLGLAYTADDPYDTLAEPFPLFDRGEGRGVENVLAGTWEGLAVRAFDYWYYEESTDSKGHTSRSYYRFDCVLASINVACAQLSMDPETLFTRLADHLSLHDIEFESEDFNKMFNVKSDDKKFANDMVDARMMQWMLTLGKAFSFAVSGHRALVTCRRLDPSQLPSLLGATQQFVDHFPSVVYDLYPRLSS
jgi:Protein of unknown function (DUF3137)